MGPATIGVHAFPTFLFDRRVEPEGFVADLLDRVASGEIDVDSGTADEAALHEVLDMMACKAAVKAGDRLSANELAALLAQREQVERSSNCPHGRPTTLRLTLRDLARRFGRT
jgi:DNA mismatch repair protein MutL